jgi:hypothetical protein
MAHNEEDVKIGLPTIWAIGVGSALGGDFFGWEFILYGGFFSALMAVGEVDFCGGDAGSVGDFVFPARSRAFLIMPFDLFPPPLHPKVSLRSSIGCTRGPSPSWQRGTRRPGARLTSSRRRWGDEPPR